MTVLALLVCLVAPWSGPDVIPTVAPIPRLVERAMRAPSGNLPVQTMGLRGVASWYATPGLTAAAGPKLRRWLGPNWRGATVVVSTGERSVAVKLLDWCQCFKGQRSERLIDLSDGAFAALAPLASGLVRVTITIPVPPRTDR